jgi:hypothetical protein
MLRPRLAVVTPLDRTAAPADDRLRRRVRSADELQPVAGCGGGVPGRHLVDVVDRDLGPIDCPLERLREEVLDVRRAEG